MQYERDTGGDGRPHRTARTVYRQKRRGDEGEEIQAEIEQITTHLRALRRDLKLCARIEGDIPKVRATVETQRPDHTRRRPYGKNCSTRT